MTSMDAISAVQERLPGYKHHWSYIENGRAVMEVARYDQGGKKTFRQYVPCNDKLVEGMPPPPYPLFGLHSLKNKCPLDAVLICEGEKCAALLHQLSWPAVATVLGAQNPAKSDWAPLRYFSRFVILRDNDEAGIKFTRSVAKELQKLSPSCGIFVLNLTPRIKGGDLIDWAQQTVLLGNDWDGFSPLSENYRENVVAALRYEIDSKKMTVEDCTEVAFKPIEARFGNDPQPLSTQLSPVPFFPLHVFPTIVNDYLRILSDQFSQVPDFAGTVFILAIAGVAGRSVRLSMRPGNPWEEAPNAWGMLVGQPSSKKSPIMRRVLTSVKDLEDKAAAKYQEALKEFRAREREAKSKNEQFLDSPPRVRRYMTDDATTPKLRELFSENPHGIILRNDELKGQFERLEKPGSEGDRSFMMNCWSGLEVYSEDRMCRDSNINIPLALTWIGGIQPVVLQRHLREAMGRSSGADGFAQRFQLICYPDLVTSYSITEETLPDSLTNSIRGIFRSIDEKARADERVLRFSSEAQKMFDTWHVSMENEARMGRHPAHWESHLGKQPTALAISVIVLHLLSEEVEGEQSDEISAEILNKALELQKYYLKHACRCYESVVGGAIDDARAILQLLRDKRLEKRFKAQDIYRKGLGGLERSERVLEALSLLEDYGWVVQDKVPAGPDGGRNHKFWVLHPRAFEHD